MPITRPFGTCSTTGRRFVVPDYQRSYSWDREQRSDLFQDLERLQKLLAADREASHFCGTVICTPSGGDGREFAVVDGQQRLSTLVLVHARMLSQLTQPNPLAEGGAPRFHPQTLDDDVFTALFRGDTYAVTTDAQRRYVEAVKETDDWLAPRSDAEVSELRTLVEQRLHFIFFVLQNDDEVARAFEAINNRGKSLTQLDLVKNHLLYVQKVHGWSRPDVNETWREIMKIAGHTDFGDSDADTVLRATVTAQFRPGKRKAGETDYKIVSREVAVREAGDEESARERFGFFVRFLERNFRTYQQLRAARSSDERNPIVRQLTFLNHHDNLSGVLPLIFARQFRRRSDQSDAPVLEAIEKTNFRLYGLPDRASRSDSYNVRLYSLAHNYFHDDTAEQERDGS